MHPIPSLEVKNIKDRRVVVEVVDVKGKCPVYKKGDKIVIDGGTVNLEETDAICTRIFGTGLLSYTLLMEKGHKEQMDEVKGGMYFKCPPPGEPYTELGHVVFRMFRMENIV